MNDSHPTFAHLSRLTTDFGLHEHAHLSRPRPEHGYCVDDAARALVLLCREPSLDVRASDMLAIYLDLIIRAITINGRCHNRMSVEGKWIDRPGTGDWWGRALWSLGVAAVLAPLEGQRRRALFGFRVLSRTSSPDMKANAFAVLGAGELLLFRPDEMCARGILSRARLRLTSNFSSQTIWPEPRLTYSNGSIPEASILIGMALVDARMLQLGLDQLELLIRSETRFGHFSVTPVGGRDLGAREVGFDQQPIELAAIADACARASQATGDERWVSELYRAWSWFLGNNDVGAVMFDAETHGGYDGLHARGPNLNQGAESTISLLSTSQRVKTIKYSPESASVLSSK